MKTTTENQKVSYNPDNYAIKISPESLEYHLSYIQKTLTDLEYAISHGKTLHQNLVPKGQTLYEIIQQAKFSCLHLDRSIINLNPKNKDN